MEPGETYSANPSLVRTGKHLPRIEPQKSENYSLLKEDATLQGKELLQAGVRSGVGRESIESTGGSNGSVLAYVTNKDKH